MPLRLAENPRTQIKAAIKRASAQARANMNRVDKEVLGDLNRIYQRAAEEIAAAIRNYGDADGSLLLQVLRDMRNQINARLAFMEEARNELLNNSLVRAAELGSGAFTSVQVSSQLTNAADEAVRFVHNFVGEDGLQLSDRIWRVDNHARTAVGNAVENAVIQGHSASQAATEFLERGENVPREIVNKINASNAEKVSRLAANELIRGTSSPRYNALRVFRTELNRAHGEAYMASGEGTEDFGGWRYLLSPSHPEPDICDMHSRVNRYGLGPGVYPDRKRTPWPAHPNTLSYVVIVFSDEVSEADRAKKEDRIGWLNQQPPHIQEGVLGSRKKRAALQRGILKESQIATPWRVLKKRYAGQGIDIEKLQIKPVSISIDPANAPVTVQAEAWDYVLGKGENTGWEHAVIYDMNTGREFIKKTTRRKNFVSFELNELAIMHDPRNRLDLVHNHPNSSSLSLADLRMGTLKGVHQVTAIGHDGSVFISKTLIDSEIITSVHEAVDVMTSRRIWPKIKDNSITVDDANIIHGHIVNSVLGELNLIDYSYSNLGSSINKVITKMDGDFSKIIESIKGKIIEEVLNNG